MPYTIGGITVDPTKGPVGTGVTIRGWGFEVGETFTLTIGGIARPPAVTVAAGGVFTVPRTVPAAPAGPQPVHARGRVVRHSVTFTVEVPVPTITLSPATAVSGTTITVSGEHFPGDVRVLVRWATIDGMLIGFESTDAAGRFTTSVTIPLARPDAYRIFVHREGDLTVNDYATFTIPSPVIKLTPPKGPVGQPVIVAGESFPALSTIVIRWKGKTPGHIMLPPEALTNALGAFSTGITIPVDLSGPQWIYAYVRDFADPVTKLPLIFARASYTIEPGVPRIGVKEGFHAIWGRLDHSVWRFMDGEWRQHHTDPIKHAMIDPAKRFEHLDAGMAYWFFLKEPIEAVLVGGMRWTLSAGWHNRGWIP
ncbi:MAG: hypothetical protein DDT29_02424 [Dehalococcoidia bacterium]|nr:hypothetical protein [Bacillota bacterium]